MKKMFSLLFLGLAAVIFITSCSKQPKHINTIPGDSFAVIHFKPEKGKREEMVKKLEENENYQETMKDLRKESEVMADILEDFIKDPSSIGLDMNAEIFGFSAPMEDKNMYYGLSFLMKKQDKFEKVLKDIAGEMEMDITINDEDGFKHVSFPMGILIWNKEKAMALGSDKDFDAMAKAKTLMNQDKKDAIINTDKDFAEFYENCLDANIWVSSNIDNMRTEMSMMGKMAGVELTDNYAHMHFDWDKKAGQFMMIAKLRVNEDIKNMDINDIEKIMEETNALAGIGPLFGSGKPYGYDQAWDEDSLSEEDYEEALSTLDTVSEEDIDAMLKELEKELDKETGAE